MGVIESARGVLWARRRQPDEVAYLLAVGHERFTPRDLLEQAVEAEVAGFDGVCCSDHLTPWWAPTPTTPAACGNAWVWLGAVGQATNRVALGTAVTSVIHRYNPVVLAQQIATLEEMCPGRAFLGVGTGEAMNEVPAGLDWPSPQDQIERAAEALEVITRLLDGETVTFNGRFFKTRDARLYLRTEQRPPIFMSAFGPQAAEVAGRFADGIWTLADPQKAPAVIASYRRAAEKAGRPPGEVILQGMVSWADDDEAALEGSREWKPTLVDTNYSSDVHTPEDVGATAGEVSDTKFTTMGLVSSDPKSHVRKLTALKQMGATAIVVMNISGADPHGTIRTYGKEVLPQLRD
jgi:coenzyme F420-dependent glucose-6-phosphate dehydrogenase